MTHPLQLLVRQADTVLHTDLVAYTTLLAQDGHRLDLDAVLDDAGGVAGQGQGRALDTGPGADLAAPTDDRVHDAGIVLDLRVLEDDGLLDAGATADGGTWADRDVGSQLGGRVDVGRRVNENGRDDVGRGLGKLLGAVLAGLLEVQGIGGHGRAGGLDLAPKVLGLVYEELLAIGHVAENILLEADNLALALIVVVVVLVEDEGALEVLVAGVAGQARSVGATLNGALDGGEDNIGAEEVDTAVDEVGDVALGLLDVVQHALGVVVANNAAKVCGGLCAHTRAQDDGLCILLGEELEHLVEGEGAADVRVQDEQALGLALENGVAEVVQAAGGAQGLVLAQVLDGEVWEVVGGIFDEIAEDGLVIVADEVDLVYGGDFGDGGQAVVNDGVARDIEEGLR